MLVCVCVCVCAPRATSVAPFRIVLIAYIYSLDGTTTYQYNAGAVSSYGAHSLIGAIGTAQAIVLGTSLLRRYCLVGRSALTSTRFHSSRDQADRSQNFGRVWTS